MDHVQINDLKLHGDIADGFLDGIENTATGLAVHWTSGCCWEVKIQRGNDILPLSGEDFHFQRISGVEGEFKHKTMPLTINLCWYAFNAWAAACRIGFQAGDGVRVAAVTFRIPGRFRPCGENQADYLIYPFKTGIKIDDPAQTVFREFTRKDTKYGPADKMRHLNVIQSGLAPINGAEIETSEEIRTEILNDYSQVVVSDHIDWGRNSEYTYPATISMTWMDYCGPDGGMYLGAHDPELEKTGLFFSAERGKSGIAPGIDKIFNRRLDAWSGDFVIGLHPDDWHAGAELYREYMNALLPGTPDTPEYFRQSPGIISHYDMKWEDGTVTHGYSDLPDMYREAQAHGYDTLLLAGWNNGGFDNYSLKYGTDPDLGTEEQLKTAIRQVHQAGGKVFFYVNALSISMDCADYPEPGREYAVVDQNGEIDCFGEFFLIHPMATMCSNVSAWRDCIKRNIKYVLLELAADGVYLDQIGSAPRDCYAEHHDHREAWSMNYRNMLREVRQELAAAGKKEFILLTERAMDLHKDMLDCFLCYSFWQCSTELSFPAMFRYTFPEVLLVDMVLQKPWAGRQAEEDRFVMETFCRQFINGLKYWTYCHAPDNAVLKPFFDSAIKLYKYAVEYFTHGRYLDENGVSAKTPALMIREFAMSGRGRMFAVWNPTGKDASFRLKNIVSAATIRTLEQCDDKLSLPVDGKEIPVPPILLCLIEVTA